MLVNRVDKGLDNPVQIPQEPFRSGQGREETASKICAETWSEFILIAQYLLRNDKEATIADVFEFIRTKDLGGLAYSKAVLKRADREVATDCGSW